MADRKRGMGRGLSAILPESSAGGPELRELPVAEIAPNPDQPRSNFEPTALDALADSELRTDARVSGSFTSQDDNARVGRKVTIGMSSEWGISGTYIAERVEISYERGRTRPQFRVSCGSVSATQDLYAIFRRLLAGQ